MNSVRLTPQLLLATAAFMVAISPAAMAAGEDAAQAPSWAPNSIREVSVPVGEQALQDCTPLIAVEPTTLDFGEVPQGTTSTLNLTIENLDPSSSCELEISNFELAGGGGVFTFPNLPGLPFIVQGGSSVILQVVFAPSAPTTYNGTITIESNDATNPSVQVTVTGEGGAPPQPPEAVAGGPYTGTAGQEVTFDGSGSSDPDGTIVSYAWEFGDGTSGSGAMPTHSYASAGTYTVTLTVTDDDDLTDEDTTTATIQAGGVTITVTAPEEGADFVPGEMTSINWSTSALLDARQVDNVDIRISEDGGSTYQFLALDEPNDGTYEWTVANTFASDTAVIRVQDAEDENTFGLSGTFSISNVRVTRPNGMETFVVDDEEEITWDRFGGEIANVQIELSRDGGTTWEDLAASEANDGAFTWTVAGNETAEALVRISDAGSSAAEDISDDTFTITLLTPPICDAGGPYEGETGEDITFDGSGSSDPDGTVESWGWQFGDGEIGSGETTTHSYATAATYTVTLTVTDNDALTSMCATTATITGGGGEPPVCDAGGPYAGAPDADITFDGSGSSDPDGTVESWDWMFGDGTTGSGETTTHSYGTAGSYTVTLTVTDNDAMTSSCSTTATVTEEEVPPVCDAGGPYAGVPDIDVTFDGSGSSDPDGTIDSYAWDFGDGSTGSGVAPTHAYTALGSYTVMLTVTDDDLLTSECSTTADIQGNQLPTCDNGGPYEAIVFEPVTFDASGSSDPDGTIVSYLWEFHDGGIGDVPVVEHTFVHLGTYPVTLTVTDNAGGSSECPTEVTVGLQPGTVRVAVPPKVFGLDGDDVSIPVFLLDDVTGDDILSTEIDLTYDSLLLDFQTVNLAGTIGEGGTYEYSIETLGPRRKTLHVSIAWVAPLEGCESMANLVFNVTRDPIIDRAPLDLEVAFNEGEPPVFAMDGEFVHGVLGDVNGSSNVSAIDASLVLQETVGLIDLPDPDYPFFTVELADVSGNGLVSALDASLILRFVLGMIDVFPAADQLMCGEPFAGGRDGIGTLPVAGSRTPRAATLGLGQAPVESGEVAVDLALDELAGVLGGEFAVRYDPRVLRAVGVETHAADGELFASHAEHGVIHVSMAAAAGRSGAADLATLRFARRATLPTELTIEAADLNEGQIPVEVSGLEVPAGAVAVQQDSVGVAVPPRVFGGRTQDAAIPFFLEDDVTGMEVYSAQIVLAYRPSVIQAVGVDLAGTIGEDGVVEFNVVPTGPDRHEAHISIAWVEPLEGCEEFARLLVEVQDTRDQSALHLVSVTLNEGDPPVRTSDGLFIIGLLGDVNASGEVSALDASLVLQEVVGLIELPSQQYPAFTLEIADVSGNGEIRAFDAALILQYVIGMLDEFPALEMLSCGDSPAPVASNPRARSLGLVEVGRGPGWVEYALQADDLSGVHAAEVELGADGAFELLSVESAGQVAGTLVEYREHAGGVTIAVAHAAAADGGSDLALVRVADGTELGIAGASLDEGRVPVVLDGAPVTATAPIRFRLGQNVPNPFNPATVIHFATPRTSHVRLAIHDASGRLVRLLVDGVVEAGAHRARWDGRDARGMSAGAGVYFYSLEAPHYSETRKMILLK
ncbi:MAG: PKD domain-containing protein [Candidatus Eiseniibacteriota bacterium]|jgi:PKD repeat protein